MGLFMFGDVLIAPRLVCWEVVGGLASHDIICTVFHRRQGYGVGGAVRQQPEYCASSSDGQAFAQRLVPTVLDWGVEGAVGVEVPLPRGDVRVCPDDALKAVVTGVDVAAAHIVVVSCLHVMHGRMLMTHHFTSVL